MLRNDNGGVLFSWGYKKVILIHSKSLLRLGLWKHPLYVGNFGVFASTNDESSYRLFYDVSFMSIRLKENKIFAAMVSYLDRKEGCRPF